MSNVLTIFLIVLACAIPACILGVVQYFLSRLTPPWPGLILPVLSGLFSLLPVCLLLFNLVSISPFMLLVLLLLLALFNLPTAAYIAIYCITRRRFKKQNEVTRMNLQDL